MNPTRNALTAAALAGTALAALAQTPTPVRAQFGPVTTAKFNSIPDFVLPDIYKDRTKYPLPATMDLTKNKFMPPYNGWSIQGWSCANATGTTFVYGFEAQRVLNTPSSGNTPNYPYEYTYHFLNSANQAEGGDGWMFVEAFDILKETGAPTTSDFGGFEFGNGSTAWMSGYDKYYKAMKIRAQEYYKIDASSAANDEKIKQILVDHGDGSPEGGLLTFQMSSEDMPTQTINGRRTLTSLSGEGHALVIAGYDDNHAGGSYLCVNNWGDGIYWAPYKLFRAGGKLANKYGTPVMFVRVRKNYTPQLTFKITISHDSRNKIALMTGVAPSAAATTATKWKDYAGAFNFAGGSAPMMGKNGSSTIEIGLDLTDFTPLLTGKDARFFFSVVSKGGSGKIDNVTLMDYTGGGAPKEIAGTEPGKAIAGNSTTTVSIPWTGSVTALRRALAPLPAAHVNTRVLDMLGRALPGGRADAAAYAHAVKVRAP
jgi:hypothetical protein